MRAYKRFKTTLAEAIIYIQKNRRTTVFFGIGAVLLTAGAFFAAVQLGSKNTDVYQASLLPNKEEQRVLPLSALRGEPCARGDTRPFAVMLAEDARARPLSGIGSADVVIEMPVLKSGMNRFMAIFQCTVPSEIGSVRSARHDFIPLAAGFDAIYAHWGGSHYALDELKTGIIDDIDALPNPYGAFWRKNFMPAPHNGFTSGENLMRAAEGMGYRIYETIFAGYSRKGKELPANAGTLRIGYPSVVLYEYDAGRGAYARWRGGTKEIDALTHKQVEASIVIVMEAASRQIEPDYNDVDIEGEGTAYFFQEGGQQVGKWEKDSKNLKSKLMFLGKDGSEIPLVPGTLWIQIVDPGTEVRWQQK